MTQCWCGSTELIPFNAEYAECSACGTLISQESTSAEELLAGDDDAGFYGKDYWLGHQSDNLGFPDIYKRARSDLSERNLHWLKALLRLRLPSARVMELGCSHGGFVALLRLAGYDASGVELSPWVVDFAQRAFGVPVSIGPVEKLDLPAGSLDVIVLMDVLEHLPDPLGTMDQCLKLLKPEGLMLIQTPQYKRGTLYADLVEKQAPFLKMLQSNEHLYLFTAESAAQMFRQIGARHIQFEPAIFSQYDMFFAVSQCPLHTHSTAEVDAALQATPGGRIAQAVLDLREREIFSLSDRIARGEQIEALTKLLEESEADRDARWKQIEILTEMVHAAQNIAPSEEIATLRTRLEESEADRAARWKQIETLTAMMHAAQDAQSEQIATLTSQLEESEADRAARWKQIETLTAMVHAAQDAQSEQIATLTTQLKESEEDRAARWEQIETLTEMVRAAQKNQGNA